ncbi:Putative BPI/LBP family protein At1g04970 [Linum perenne]
MEFPLLFFLFSSLLLRPSSVAANNLDTHLLQSTDHHQEGHISVLLTQRGIDFAKDVLIGKSVSSLIPIQLDDIQKSVKIPVVGTVSIRLSDITIYQATVGSSYAGTQQSGIDLVASGITAKMRLKWDYSYKLWFVEISDDGVASVQIEGMRVGVNASLKVEGGTPKLSVLSCVCYVEDVSIDVEGGASWLYQALVDAFQNTIKSKVEKAVANKIRDGIAKLDTKLQSIPKLIKIDPTAALNVTFVNDPIFHSSSVELQINGLFTSLGNSLIPYYYRQSRGPSLFCDDGSHMIGIALHEDVLDSAATAYFNADYMNWTINKFPDQSLLNTATWKDVCPELYEQYPNDDIIIDISAVSPPIITIAEDDGYVGIFLDATVKVLNGSQVVPVACLSVEINATCTPQIMRNNLTGSLGLRSFILSPKWSKIGNLQTPILEEMVSTIIGSVFIPYVNLHMRRGFPLPIIHGFRISDGCSAEMASSSDAWMKEYNEAAKLSEDITGMISERTSLPSTGPDSQRHASATRRKITILGTRLDSLQSLLTKLPGKQQVSEKEMNRRRDMIGNLRTKANQMASTLNMSNFANRDSLLGPEIKQADVMNRTTEQDEGLEKLEETVISTKHIALAVNEELDLHTRLIDDLDEHVDVTDSRLRRVQKQLGVLNKRTKGGCTCMCMLLAVIGIVALVVVIYMLVKYL